MLGIQAISPIIQRNITKPTTPIKPTGKAKNLLLPSFFSPPTYTKL